MLGGEATFSFESTVGGFFSAEHSGWTYASEASYVGEQPLCASLGRAWFEAKCLKMGFL